MINSEFYTPTDRQVTGQCQDYSLIFFNICKWVSSFHSFNVACVTDCLLTATVSGNLILKSNNIVLVAQQLVSVTRAVRPNLTQPVFLCNAAVTFPAHTGFKTGKVTFHLNSAFLLKSWWHDQRCIWQNLPENLHRGLYYIMLMQVVTSHQSCVFHVSEHFQYSISIVSSDDFLL